MIVSVSLSDGPAAGQAVEIEDARVGTQLTVTTRDPDDNDLPTMTDYMVVQRVGNAGIARVAWS